MITSKNPKHIAAIRPNEGKIFLEFKPVHLVAVAQVVEYGLIVGLEILIKTSVTIAPLVVRVRPQTTTLVVISDTTGDQVSGYDHELVKIILESLSGFLVGPLLTDDSEDLRRGPTTRGVI